MQGRWIDADDPSIELIIDGEEVACFGRTVEYDYKLIWEDDGAVTVSLMVNDEADEDSCECTNITGLAITPEGALHAYNVKFASQSVRAPDGSANVRFPRRSRDLSDGPNAVNTDDEQHGLSPIL